MDDQGSVVAESRHYPYGEELWRWPQEGAFPTDYRFTGQRSESGLGDVYHMGARWYDSVLGRWLSADTLVPEPANPQSLNRYSWALGNPLKYIDPTGHWEEEWEEQFEEEHGRPPTEQDWWDYQFSLQIEDWIAALWEQTYDLRSLLWSAEVTIKADDLKWTVAQAELVREAVQRIANRFGGDVRRFIGGVTVILQARVKPWFTYLYDPRGDYNGFQYGGKIYMEPDIGLAGLIHEMGHYWDHKDHLSREYWRQVRSFMIIPSRTEDFAESFRYYVMGIPSWPPPGSWSCSSQGCAYPIDRRRYNYFEQYRIP